MWVWAAMKGGQQKGTPPIPAGFPFCYRCSLRSSCSLDVQYFDVKIERFPRQGMVEI